VARPVRGSSRSERGNGDDGCDDNECWSAESEDDDRDGARRAAGHADRAVQNARGRCRAEEVDGEEEGGRYRDQMRERNPAGADRSEDRHPGHGDCELKDLRPAVGQQLFGERGRAGQVGVDSREDQRDRDHGGDERAGRSDRDP
jgi:hypothetical protein